MIRFKNGALDLVAIGRENLRNVHRNYPKPILYEEIINKREGQISNRGPIVVRTGHFKERTYEDRFIVKEPLGEAKVHWSEKVQPISEEHYNLLLYRLLAYMQNKEVYVQNCLTCPGTPYETPIRIITERAWHSLFARNMYMPILNQKDPQSFNPSFSVIHIPGFHAIPEMDGTRSNSFIIIHMTHKVAIIAGTCYAGDMRQAVFTMLNYILPHDKIFPMRCSSAMNKNGDVALFFGRENTGKTTLAIDSELVFIGDSAHGWTNEGIFNYEAGCYARVLNVSSEHEVELFELTRQFGTVLENVTINPETRRIDRTDASLTDNTRAAFSNQRLSHVAPKQIQPHPKHIFLVTCDAFGVLPPIARLTHDQAVYGFLSSYSSEFKRTESGQIVPTFNVCFGESSLTFPPSVYARQFSEKIKDHQVTCWLLNTGWIGEPYGKTDRISIDYSRTLVRAAISGQLNQSGFEVDPVFQFEIPLSCPNVPTQVLHPRQLAEDPGEYEVRANRLAMEFMKDFSQFENEMPDHMRAVFSQILHIDDQLNFETLGFSM